MKPKAIKVITNLGDARMYMEDIISEKTMTSVTDDETLDKLNKFAAEVDIMLKDITMMVQDGLFNS